MASYSRTQRIAEEIRKVISTMLISGIKDYRINSMVSVTDVEVTSDLSYAYVYVSILGGDKESSMKGLKSACGYIRKEVGRSVKLRHTPEIIFKLDDSIEKGMYMESLIKKVNEDSQKGKKYDFEDETQGE
ncbi:MAG: 30S ribosome-binding factor RbfA [Peptostreptococcaceae bacterium]|mgnify:CR=1 FL=1|jgi:ribosome-binding factor A|nr:30S ribosome-binding factor RbfA [Peptostreptococcaceae bacterium]MBP3930361.1 30S ribosome-binding factor RbfA [Peptostreptococcaceae bacterium]MBQ1793244.1 30S ribosome-binding factor RbfA [Peptostreptococcaceae bacterium]